MDKSEIVERLDIKGYYSGELSPTPIKWNGENGMTLCPFHDDTNPSLSINYKTGQYKCFGCDKKGSIFDFYMERRGVDFKTALEELAKEAGVKANHTRTIKDTFDYKDEGGNLLFQTVRYEPKDFTQRRPDGNGGWIYEVKGTRLVPYNLLNVLKAQDIFIPEGEPQVDILKVWGLVGTCNPMGAGKWKSDYNEHFKDKHVVVLPDNDEPGRRHAQKVAENLSGVAASVRVVQLPGLEQKGDIIDWVKQGGTKEALLSLVKQAKEWEPLTTTPCSAMPLTKLNDLLNEPEEIISWLVDDILPTGGFSILVAKPKVGKSTLGRNLALAIARGVSFLGRPTLRGPVIYYALEEKRAEVRRHFKDMGATGDEEIYTYAGGAPVDALKHIFNIATQIKPALIIIDPLFRLARVRDGNDYAQVTQALEPILRLARETGAHVLCIHHASKGERTGGDGVLGSTAILGSVDTSLFMKRYEKYRTIQTIQRYGNDLEETTLHFNCESRTVSIGQTRHDEDLSVLKEAIRDYLTQLEEPIVESEIDVEGRTGLKRKALRALVDEGIVKRGGKGGKGDPYKYSCSLVPTIYREQENKNPENGITPCKQSENACSGVFADFGANVESREQAFWGAGTSKLDPAEMVIDLSGADVTEVGNALQST